MKKNKKRIIIEAIIVLILGLVFLFMLFGRLYKLNLFDKKAGDGIYLVNEYDLANLDNKVYEDDVILIPKLIDDSASDIVAATVKNVDYPEPFVQQDFRPIGESAQQRDQLIKIGSLGFEPKEVFAVYPSKVTLKFEVLDDNDHEIVFLDEAVSHLSASLGKNEKFLTRTFISPEPGDYEFYIDSEDNKGLFKVFID